MSASYKQLRRMLKRAYQRLECAHSARSRDYDEIVRLASLARELRRRAAAELERLARRDHERELRRYERATMAHADAEAAFQRRRELRARAAKAAANPESPDGSEG